MEFVAKRACFFCSFCLADAAPTRQHYVRATKIMYVYIYRITGALCVHVLFAVTQMSHVTSPDEAEYFRSPSVSSPSVCVCVCVVCVCVCAPAGVMAWRIDAVCL